MCTGFGFGASASNASCSVHADVLDGAAQVLRRLERLVEAEQSASDDPDLVFLTSLLQLAAGCRSMLRSRRFSFPAADPELLHSFYPLIMNFMLEVQIQDPNEPDSRSRSLNA